MGHNVSLPRGRRKSLRSFVKKPNAKHILSHTFTVCENDDHIELLNINIATEEELMTLPGVNREIAKNIVDHRKAIGRYRKIEDIAVVRGVGAHKLNLIKPEICVSSRRYQSTTSSRAPSYDSLKSTDSKITNRSNRLININKASVFELQSIPGITQEIAAGIIILRNKKGRFKKLDDLLKIKYINRMRLDNIIRYLTIDDDEDGDEDNYEPTSPRPSVLTNGFSTMYSLNGYRSSQVSQISNGLAASSVTDIFELLSTYSPRPVISEYFKFSRNGEPAIRICSWNLHEFSMDKANNLGVKEVICRTILENCLSLLAVQDITDVMALKTICDELNKPTLRRVEEWKENSQSWNFCMLDICGTRLGYIYDSAGVANVELISLKESPEDTKNDCEALIAHFRVGDMNLQLVNMSLNKDANIQFLYEKVTDLISEGEMVMLFIDFSKCYQIDEQSLKLGGLKPIFSANTNTHFPVLKANNHCSHISNILTNNEIRKNLTGYKNIISRGITHLAIPNGWSWGGPVSPYCPIWLELFLTDQSGSTAL